MKKAADLIFAEALDLLKIIAQKIKFYVKDFFSKCDQMRRKLRIWSHLLNEFLMENFTFIAVTVRGNSWNNFNMSPKKEKKTIKFL